MILLANRSTHEIYDQSYNYTVALALDEDNLLPGDAISLAFLVDAEACAQLEDASGAGVSIEDVFGVDEAAGALKHVQIDFVVTHRHHYVREMLNPRTCFQRSGSDRILEPLTPRAGEVLEWVFEQYKPVWEAQA